MPMARFQGPDEIYGALFAAVQSSQLFPDSKTFADARPIREVAAIIRDFGDVDAQSTSAIRRFVEQNFLLPETNNAASTVSENLPVRERIDELWQLLSRDADHEERNSTLIALPHPYIVPGGRFREIYYWDSYFTMLGLAEAGRVTMIENMVCNFAFLIDQVGFVPNGNRSYFSTRSQPPFFVLMVELLANIKDDRSIIQRFLPQLRREYDFWMRGARVQRFGDAYLNRYWDDSDKPRAESFAGDLRLAEVAGRPAAGLYRDLRAACESGWDFSSRWFPRGGSIATIRTTSILPVDLNSLLFHLERTLAAAYADTGDDDAATFFADRATQRKQLLQGLFFDTGSGMFVDLIFPEMTPTGVASLATAFPLFLDVATPEQAIAVARKLQKEFLASGGWRTTLQTSGQQWDRPNGWAPLQWIVFQGLRNYALDDDANLGARRWAENNLDVYEQTGRLMEKYHVEEIGSLASGGEYVVQDGFGWTNAVLLKLMNHLGL